MYLREMKKQGLWLVVEELNDQRVLKAFWTWTTHETQFTLLFEVYCKVINYKERKNEVKLLID